MNAHNEAVRRDAELLAEKKRREADLAEMRASFREDEKNWGRRHSSMVAEVGRSRPEKERCEAELRRSGLRVVARGRDGRS